MHLSSSCRLLHASVRLRPLALLPPAVIDVRTRMHAHAPRPPPSPAPAQHLMDAAAVELERTSSGPGPDGPPGGGHETAPAAHGDHAAAALRWTSLGVPPEEMTLDFCLPTGQTFRFHKEPHAEGRYIGVLGQRLVRMQQGVSDVFYMVLARAGDARPEEDDAAVRDFFNLPASTARSSAPAAPVSAAGAASSASALGTAQADPAPPHPSGATSIQGVSLRELGVGWRAACKRYAHLSPYIPGARMLRQPPLECLFSFICSSNNHISRIHGMVQRLCQAYGTPLTPALPLDTPTLPLPPGQTLPSSNSAGDPTTHTASPSSPQDQQPAAPGGAAAKRARRASRSTSPARGQPPPPPAEPQHPAQPSSPADDNAPPPDAAAEPPSGGKARGGKRGRAAASRAVAAPAAGDNDDEGGGAPASPSAGGAAGHLGPFYAFPSLEQLAAHASEEALRVAGFGYRAKFIVGTAAALRDKQGGGEAWLMGLRQAPYAQAAASLEELPGVGPKVAACVCLFSLDKHEAIPVDTHVWQIATRWYLPSLKGKALTKKVHGDVQAAFTQRFGPYAGWAHNAMFIAELAAHKHRIPPLPH